MRNIRLCLLPFFLAAGCSTVVNNHSQKADMMAAYVGGNGSAVADQLAKKLKEPTAFNSSVIGSGDEVCWRVERGTHLFLTGDAVGSIADFDAAKERIEDYDARALVNLRGAAAESTGLLSNPCALPYRAFARDRVMIPVFKALGYLEQGDERGFHVELNAIRSVQQEIVDRNAEYFEAVKAATEKAKAGHGEAAKSTDAKTILSHQSNAGISSDVAKAREVAHRGYANLLNPLAIYLSGWGYLQQGDAQNACIDFDRLRAALPQNDLVRRCSVTALKAAGKALPPDLASVASAPAPRGSALVIVANGRSAAFRQQSLYLPIVIPGHPILATVAWPVPEYYAAASARIEVSSDGTVAEALPLADMDAIISAEYIERLPGMITRIALSTAIKETGAYYLNEAGKKGGTATEIATWLATASYKVAFNTADTRSWEMLPKEYRVAQVPLPKSGKLALRMDGRPVDVPIPAGCSSAIVYVNAPSAAATSVRVLPFK